MARNISLFSLRTVAKIKKGRDTNVAVDASGSVCFRLKYNALPTINKDIISDAENPKTIGEVLVSTSSSFLSNKVESSDTAEKDNK